MKKTLLAIFAISLFQVLEAQTGCQAYSLQKGDSLVYKRLMPPPYDPAFAKLNAKEKVEYLKKQDADIKSGALKLREAKMTINITDRQETPTGFTEKATVILVNPTGNYSINYIYECYNDTLFVTPENQYNETENVGISYTGTIAYPMKMKVGDLLPDNKNVMISYKHDGSQKFLMPYISKTTTTHYIDATGSEVYKTIENTWSNKEVTNHFSSITTMETTYANREVTGDTTITYKGRQYKGYIISCYLLPSTSIAVTADYFQKSMQRMLDRKMAKAARKLAADESGVFTTYIQDVFVPEIGIVSTVMKKKDGSFFSASMLKE